MYLPSHFAETRTAEIRHLIETHPLGTLVTNGAQGLDANQLPFDLAALDEDRGLLQAHVARANPLWQDIADGSEVLVVFRAADAYISPNWYPSKKETHRHVPTWNYRVVNLYGRIRFVHDEKFLRAVLGRLTRTHETRAEGEQAWRMADAPPDYMAMMLKAVVGVEIEVNRIVAKSKLGQNRETTDRLGAAGALEDRGHHELASVMRKA